MVITEEPECTRFKTALQPQGSWTGNTFTKQKHRFLFLGRLHDSNTLHCPAQPGIPKVIPSLCVDSKMVQNAPSTPSLLYRTLFLPCKHRAHYIPLFTAHTATEITKCAWLPCEPLGLQSVSEWKQLFLNTL